MQSVQLVEEQKLSDNLQIQGLSEINITARIEERKSSENKEK